MSAVTLAGTSLQESDPLARAVELMLLRFGAVARTLTGERGGT